MARLEADPERERRAARRACGTCSHCCTVLRVDELGKAAGRDCVHQRGERGCGIHATRPTICRAYRCLWLQGGLEEDERPDRTGGVVDLETTGVGLRLAIREVRPDFPRPERVNVVAWPLRVGALRRLGVIDAIRTRLGDLDAFDALAQLDRVVAELERSEDRELRRAVTGEGYRTLWTAPAR